MAKSILPSPAYFTAENLAACDLSTLDGVPVDQHGGISRAEFLRYFEGVSREAALFFTSENA
ncbi:MAG: hypothetical protein EPN70_18855 [Paraburkholderia sp.]|uniref:hypothetical protein n=1 Tax=Paraburkholderia sp. TaxID=1926495 RepID=UPI0012041A56|nr:hypothetical protein [Paraburkholderia sp.]TAM01716.1 MAG: hypothetical protein EPN70_18855 [Paraburkholderia sp.]